MIACFTSAADASGASRATLPGAMFLLREQSVPHPHRRARGAVVV
jgi:hypothetical protein